MIECMIVRTISYTASIIQSISHSTIHSFFANLAQLAEQLIRNEQVAGSIPAVGSSIAHTI